MREPERETQRECIHGEMDRWVEGGGKERVGIDVEGRVGH